MMARLDRRHRIASAVWLMLAVPAIAYPLDPEKRISQYVFDVWQTRDGLPINAVFSIAQTPDGYLWLATLEGLVRFDGVRFRVFGRTDRRSPSTLTRQLLVDGEGRLWLGTDHGLAQWRNGVVPVLTTREGLLDNYVRCLYEDRQRVLWIGTSGGLNRLEGGRLTSYTTRDGLPHNSVQSVFQARDGALWIGTSAGLARLLDGTFTTYTSRQGLAHDAVHALHEDRDGNLWIGTFGGLSRFKDGRIDTFTAEQGFPTAPIDDFEEDGAGSLWLSSYGAGIGRLRSGRFERFGSREGLMDDLPSDIHLDRQGSLWISMHQSGLSRLRDGLFTAYTTREGLAADVVLAVLEDRAGAVWMATQGGGLSRLSNGVFTTFTRKDGLLSDQVFAIREDREGSLWIGSYNGGLNRFKDGRFLSYTTDQLPRGIFITGFHQDREGAIWIATAGGGLKRFSAGAFETYMTKEGLAHNYVWSIAEDGEGGLWVGTRAGLSRWKDGSFQRHDPEEGWLGHEIYALHADDEGSIWIGTSGGGLSRLKERRFTHYTTSEGLPDDTIYAILDDRRGYFWMSCNKGIFRVRKSELTELAEGKRASVGSVVYGVGDGMKTAECNGGTQPAGWRSRDGRLWFATAKGAVVVDPSRADEIVPSPASLMEEVLVENQPVTRTESEKIPSVGAGSRQFEFHYAAPGARTPERVRFRYKVEGVDRDWIDAGARRVAYYTSLPPGRHRFRVIAGHEGSAWNEAGGASFSFRVEPFFYQTWWFYALCAVAVSSALWAGHRYRLERVLEMERVRMRIASDLHDDIGSSLSQIAILSEVARARVPGEGPVAEPLERIATLSRESVDAMGEIVWAIDPHRDALTDLTQRMRRLASDLLPPRGIELRFEASDAPNLHLHAEMRREVFLIFKEALHNILRHGSARSVGIEVEVSPRELRLVVKDDGRGFDTQAASDGHGLRSMRRRAESLDGSLELTSAPGSGTRLELKVPLHVGRRKAGPT
jgi:ligand-binding sensor domain-containing protein/signal transduction histidine kinase